MPSTPKRVLIVEDDSGLAELFSELLHEENLLCAQVQSGRDCLAWMATQDADLLLIDYALPDLLAPALVEALRTAGRLRPFIVITGHGDERVAVELMKLGARDYLVKDNLALERMPAVVKRTLADLEKEQKLIAAEAALRASEHQLALAMDIAHLAHWEFDVATATFTFNDRFYALYGTTAEREGGYRMSAETYAREFLLPEEAHHVSEEVQRASESSAPALSWQLEHRIRRRDGTIRFLSVNIIVLQDTAGRTVATRGANQDITERKRAEADLQRSEALFRSTFDKAPIGAAIVGRDRVFQRVNTALCRFLGYPAPELQGKPITEVTHPDDVVDTVAQIRRLLGGEVASFEIEKRYLHKDGAIVWGRVSVSLVRDADGRPLHLVPIIQDITAHKQAEAELRQTRAILQVAMDQSPAGIAIADSPSGTLRYVNDAGLLIRGGDRATIVKGVGVAQYVASWKLLDLDGRPLRTDEVPLARAVMLGEHCSREFLIHRGDGDDRAVLAKAAPIKDEAGTVVAAVVVFLDVTEQKRAERDLEQFFNLVPDLVCIASGDGFFRKLNDEWVRVFGYSKEELMARPFAEFVHPEDRAATRHEVAQETSGNSTASFVNRYRAKDGTYRWLEWNATATTPSGLLFAAARDITGHRQAEEAVRESELRYRTLANSGQGLIWTAGLDKKCNYFNQTWLDFTGRVLDQELGDGWVEGVQPDDLERCVATYVTAFDRRERFSMDYRLRHHSGEYRWIQDDGSPRFDDAGHFLGYIGHCLDITERKNSEQAMQQSLREKEALLKEVHHRVKNNLQVISSLLRLEGAQSTDTATTTGLQNMQERVRAMALLHENLYRAGNLAEVDMEIYLGNVCRQLLHSGAARAAGEIDLQLQLAPLHLEMNQALPCGLLINELVSNCLKHAFPAGRGGRIVVALQPTPEGDAWCLRVEDNGVGLPAGFDIHLLRSLGLQLVSDLSQQIQGRLEFFSPHGACFMVHFHPTPTPPPSSS